MTEIPTSTTYKLNELYTEEKVPLHFTDKELADIIKGFEMPLAPIKEEAAKIEKPQIGELADIVNGFEIPLATIREEALKIEKPQIGLPTIKRAYKKEKV